MTGVASAGFCCCSLLFSIVAAFYDEPAFSSRRVIYWRFAHKNPRVFSHASTVASGR